jgi:hypothetical protein
MSRDVRRFLVYRWRTLECSNRVPINLLQVWHDRFGFVPPFQQGAVSGWHFTLRDGGRGVVIERPNRLQVEEPVRAQMFSLIVTKHGVEDVRLANADEIPSLRVRERLPQQGDLDLVEEWPPPAECQDSVVAEYVGADGVFVGEHVEQWLPANDVEDAMRFTSADEAEAYLKGQMLLRRVTLRYVSAVCAEQDQRRMALLT